MKHKTYINHLDDLDELYDMALGKKDITTALRIKDMQIKYREEEKLSPGDLSDACLDRVIERLEGWMESTHLHK